MTTSSFAAGAYAAAQRIGGGLPLAKPAAALGESRAGGDFAGMVRQAVGEVGAAGAQADRAMQAAAGGHSDLVGVVTAVAESEAAIETLVAVRDRVIAAYEEIMRMQI